MISAPILNRSLPLMSSPASQAHADVLPRLDVKMLRDEPALTILRARPKGGAQGRLIVVFGSLKAKGSGIEFPGTLASTGRPVLFVQEHVATFYAMDRNIRLITDAIMNEMALTGTDAVDTLGVSMGGYGAIAYGQQVPIRNALSFGPRFSPDPAIAPHRRKRPLLDRLSGKFGIPTLADGLARVENGLIVHGMRGPDRGQFDYFRMPDTAEHWLVPRAGHGVAHWLYVRGQLRPLVLAALAGDRAEASRILTANTAVRADSLRAKLYRVPFHLYDFARGR